MGLFMYCPKCGSAYVSRHNSKKEAEADWLAYVSSYKRTSEDLLDSMRYMAAELEIKQQVAHGYDPATGEKVEYVVGMDMAAPPFSIGVNNSPAPKIGRTDDTPKVTAIRKGPNAGVIEALEAALEKARNGDLSSVFIAGVDGSRDGWRAPMLSNAISSSW